MSAYATASQFAQEYGLSETYQLLRDEQDELLSPELLGEGLAGAYGADRTEAEKAVCDAAIGRLASMLVDMSLFMDGYLRSAVTLPLSAADIAQTPLKTCCLELTRCQLMDDPDNLTEQQEKRCKRWDVWLKDVAAGVVRLLPAPSSTVRQIRWGKVPSIADGYGR